MSLTIVLPPGTIAPLTGVSPAVPNPTGISPPESAAPSIHPSPDPIAGATGDSFHLRQWLIAHNLTVDVARSSDATAGATMVQIPTVDQPVLQADRLNGDGPVCVAGKDLGEPTAAVATSVPDPLVLATLCNLIYDVPGEPPKSGWTAAQWNAALQQQACTSSWVFLQHSTINDNIYSGVAFQNTATGQIVVADRGTETRYDVLVSDFDILRGITPPAFTAAQDFATKVWLGQLAQGNSFPDIVVTGHSLGGAEAQYQAALLGLRGTTFAAPGVQWAAPGATANLTDYIYPEEPIGSYGPHIGNVVSIQPNGPVQWQDLIETHQFDNAGLHFINNYLEHFGATDVSPITPAQFVESALIAKVFDHLSVPAAEMAATPGQWGDLLAAWESSGSGGGQFGFDQIAAPFGGEPADAQAIGAATGAEPAGMPQWPGWDAGAASGVSADPSLDLAASHLVPAAFS